MRNAWARAIYEYSKFPARDGGWIDKDSAREVRWSEEMMTRSGTPSNCLPANCENEKNALLIARERKCTSMPHLIGFRQLTQGPNGPLPGGYVAICIMTKAPGRCLSPEWRLFDKTTREKIRNLLILAIKYVYYRAFNKPPSSHPVCWVGGLT